MASYKKRLFALPPIIALVAALSSCVTIQMPRSQNQSAPPPAPIILDAAAPTPQDAVAITESAALDDEEVTESISELWYRLEGVWSTDSGDSYAYFGYDKIDKPIFYYFDGNEKTDTTFGVTAFKLPNGGYATQLYTPPNDDTSTAAIVQSAIFYVEGGGDKLRIVIGDDAGDKEIKCRFEAATIDDLYADLYNLPTDDIGSCCDVPAADIPYDIIDTINACLAGIGEDANDNAAIYLAAARECFSAGYGAIGLGYAEQCCQSTNDITLPASLLPLSPTEDDKAALKALLTIYYSGNPILAVYIND